MDTSRSIKRMTSIGVDTAIAHPTTDIMDQDIMDTEDLTMITVVGDIDLTDMDIDPMADTDTVLALDFDLGGK